MRQVIEIQNDLANTGQLTILSLGAEERLELKGRNRVRRQEREGDWSGF